MDDKDSSCKHIYSSREYFLLARDLQQARTNFRLLELHNCLIDKTERAPASQIPDKLAPNLPDSTPDLASVQERAVNGDPNAMLSLASMYYSGTAVPKDYVIARKLFNAAAAKENVSAMNNLAFMFNQGLGGDRDLKMAVEFYKKAADRGSNTAMWNLATLYEEGVFMKRDETLSAKYLLLALRNGNDLARLRIYGGLPTWSTTTRAAVQEKLKTEGFFNGPITGKFEAATYGALDAYTEKK